MRHTKDGYLPEPPLYKTEMAPERLMYGSGELYARHYKAWLKNRSDPDKVSKMFSEQDVEKVGEINRALLNHGYRPRGVDHNGNVVFAIITTGNDVRLNPGGENKSNRIPDSNEIKQRIAELRQKFAA
jgi:4-amino-4-deoxy-L-arabinose transferase-like glycosyltransferase